MRFARMIAEQSAGAAARIIPPIITVKLHRSPMQPIAEHTLVKAFLARQRWLAIAFVSGVAWLIGFYLWVNETFTAPLEEPITLSSEGKVDRDIRIRVDASHKLIITFFAETRPRSEAMRLVDNVSSCRENNSEKLCDGSVPLRWNITDSLGRVVASDETETYGLTSFGSNKFSRTVAPSIRLPAGRYRFSAFVLRDVPEFHGMTARLSLVLPGRKASFGWQSDLAFLGGYLNFLLIIPITGLLGMILLGQCVGNWERGRRKS